MNKHKMYNEALEDILTKSWDAVYKDQVIAFSSNGWKPDNKTLETIKRNYIKLAFQLMGKNQERIFTKFYGSKQVLIQNIILYMTAKLDNDEIMSFVEKIKEANEGVVPEAPKKSTEPTMKV